MKTSTTILKADNSQIRIRISHLINQIHQRNIQENNKNVSSSYTPVQLKNLTTVKRKVA
ncbi:MAG: hypothetical protein WKF35_10620 [Ferruginibacter sp.]